ncbi:hypothetical protein GGX14DRAFT_210184 [Mycena pura]|uniref:Uncharacterized protein n=1 Tax=Mycena pura TaxID=153505 RepID=A0AAD6UXZ6_9AGAR|nr:hypothetical protein GGX14DRAFT_210184 [Mycena pura]
MRLLAPVPASTFGSSAGHGDLTLARLGAESGALATQARPSRIEHVRLVDRRYKCGARTARGPSPSANCRPSHPSRLLCPSPAHIRLTITHSGRRRRVRSSRPRPTCSTARARATRARTVAGVVGAGDTRRRIRRRGAMRARRRVLVMRAIIICMRARIRPLPRRNAGPSAIRRGVGMYAEDESELVGECFGNLPSSRPSLPLSNPAPGTRAYYHGSSKRRRRRRRAPHDAGGQGCGEGRGDVV